MKVNGLGRQKLGQEQNSWHSGANNSCSHQATLGFRRRTLILSASGSEQKPEFLRPQYPVGRTFVSSRLWTEGDLNFCIRSTPLGEHFVNSKLRTAEGDFNFCVRSFPLGEHVSVLGFEQRETPISASAVPDCGAQARASRTATIKINKKWQHEGLN